MKLLADSFCSGKIEREVKSLSHAVARLTDRKQNECFKRNRLSIHNWNKQLTEPVADTANQRGKEEVDNMRKLLDSLGKNKTPIENTIRIGKLNERKKDHASCF